VCGEAYQTGAVGEGGFKLHLFGLGEFPKFPRSAKFHTDMPATSSRCAPKAPKRKSGAARPPAGLQRCWCHGFNVGCGLIRSEWTHRLHTTKERKRIKGIISTMTCYIHRQSLTLQFLEKQVGLLVNILEKSIYEVDIEDHFNIPRGFRDEGVPVDDVDLETGDDQPHDTTMGSQDDDTFAFDFQIDQLLSPPQEPGLSLVSRTCRVFDVEPDSEPDGEEESEEEPDQDGDTYVWFKPDVWSEAEGDDDNDKLCWIQDEDTLWILPPVHGIGGGTR